MPTSAYLYSITTNQAAIIALFRVVNRYVGNLAPMPGFFSRLVITKKRKTFENWRRDSRSALAVNKLYQLVNEEFLFTDYTFYQISNRYNSDQFALINNGKVANSLLGHNGHAFFHSLIKVSV
jgi:hypothetical protein